MGAMQQRLECVRSRQSGGGSGRTSWLDMGWTARRRVSPTAYGRYVHQWRAVPAAAHVGRAGRPAVLRRTRIRARPATAFNRAMARG
ncbi:hypothetical protein ADK34_31955 [Streptomyces viridochromogenes]|uniref:Uncharacterized protein n=1 Tax=Streptomyces viridochromogenes TaxID=1938 RepID=A0A0L8JFX7_STRVR|nr:hypothetical protein ADK34_31955 [Streptomyces viridochromogenes]